MVPKTWRFLCQQSTPSNPEDMTLVLVQVCRGPCRASRPCHSGRGVVPLKQQGEVNAASWPAVSWRPRNCAPKAWSREEGISAWWCQGALSSAARLGALTQNPWPFGSGARSAMTEAPPAGCPRRRGGCHGAGRLLGMEAGPWPRRCPDSFPNLEWDWELGIGIEYDLRSDHYLFMNPNTIFSWLRCITFVLFSNFG
jgi:hypothetical protein